MKNTELHLKSIVDTYIRERKSIFGGRPKSQDIFYWLLCIISNFVLYSDNNLSNYLYVFVYSQWYIFWVRILLCASWIQFWARILLSKVIYGLKNGPRSEVIYAIKKCITGFISMCIKTNGYNSLNIQKISI